MIKKTTALFYVACDTEDCDVDAYDDYVPHYKTSEQALAYAIKHYGFTQLADGTLLCGTHNAQRECREQGHDWDEWHDCYCEGRDPDHADQCRRHRSCLSCSEWDPNGPAHPHQARPPVPAPYAVGDQAGRLIELWNWRDAQAISSLQGLTLYRHAEGDGWQAAGNDAASALIPTPAEGRTEGSFR